MRTLQHTQSSSLDRAMGLPGYSPHQQSLVRICRSSHGLPSSDAKEGAYVLHVVRAASLRELLCSAWYCNETMYHTGGQCCSGALMLA